MRLILKFKNKKINPNSISKFTVQGFIYSLLKNSRYNFLHDMQGFKFFCFSNIFESNNVYNLIISSPSRELIKTLYHSLKTIDEFNLGIYKFHIKDCRIIKTPKRFNYFKSSTPIVLFHNQTMSNHCYSFKNDDINYTWFFERLKDNALKKYNAYYDDEYYFEEPLFSSFSFKKEVAMNFERYNNKFLLIGSLWDNLTFEVTKENRKFYEFIYDAGLGEKNSTGMGFLNNVR